MKIAIISDIHNNQVNLKKVLDFCAKEKIETIICCGDLASQEMLDFLNDKFSGTIYYVFGNMDIDHLRGIEFADHIKSDKASDHVIKKYKNSLIYENFGEIELDGKKIAFVHYPNVARELAATGKYAFVFYGHTHMPWMETIEKCKIINPGNVAGEIYPPTFAVWNTENDKFELIRIHNLP
jgi:uncharacterized protein